MSFQGWDALQSLARDQSSVVTERQLRDLGIDHRRQRRLVTAGWLTEALPGAHVLGREGVGDWQRAVAASLLGGPDAVLSHTTAARVHKLPHIAAVDAVELTVPRRRHLAIPGVITHRSDRMPVTEVTAVRGVQVTTAARTLLDLSPRCSEGLLCRVVDDGCVDSLWTLDELRRAVERGRSRPGIQKLRRVIASRHDERTAENPLERRAVRALGAFAPFETQFQVVLEGHIFLLDIAWPSLLVAAECDGWTVRSRSRGKFDGDRRRNNLLVAHGWKVAHLTSAMSDDEMRAAVFPLLLQAAERGA
jgi:very-short-patch-repair endonuclease